MKFSQIMALFAIITTIFIGVVQCNSESNITIRNSDGSLKPIYEIMRADRATINLWIQEVGDVNHEDEGDMYHQGGTALMWAIVFGKKDIVKYLIEEQGANIDQEIRQTGETALVTAIRNEKTDLVDYLVKKGANVNYVNRQKEYEWDTPLNWAILNGNKNTVKLLLDNGAKLRGVNGTEFVWAVMNGNTEIASLLIQRGANVNTPIKVTFLLNCSYTPLQFATEHANIQMVEFLLRNGADVHLKNCDGNTALHIASNLDAGQQPEKIVEYLLRWGANRQSRNEFGQTPLDIATKKGNAKVIDLLSNNRTHKRYTRTGKVFFKKY